MTSIDRPSLDSLACVNAECERYGQAGKQNLTVRKTYGKDEIRYLHCSLAFAHRIETRRDFACWSVTVYNWVRPHRSLRLELEVPQAKKCFQPRTPAMMMGLADRIWEVAELLRCPVYPRLG